MAYEDQIIDELDSPISDLATIPTLDATALKAYFDASALQLLAAHNALVEAVGADKELYDAWKADLEALNIETNAAAALAAAMVVTNALLNAHKSRHAAGGLDALSPSDIGAVYAGAHTYDDAAQAQIRSNVSAAKAVNGVADAIEAAVVINTQTDNYTAALTDLGKDIWIGSASNKTFTIPLQSAVPWVDKSYFFLTRAGSGTLTIAGASGVTVNSAGSRLKVAEQNGTVMIRRTAENVWLATGSLSA